MRNNCQLRAQREDGQAVWDIVKGLSAYIYIGEIKSKILKDNRGRGMRKYIKGEG